MATYRQFWLVNSNSDTLNNKYYFTDKAKLSFLENPAGLGLKKSVKATRFGDSEVISSEQLENLDFSGNLIFYKGITSELYQEYDNFIEFIKYKPLELHYQTPNSLNSKYCKVVLTSIEKGDISYYTRTLNCPITFHRLTPWLNSTQTELSFSKGTSGSGKYYDLTRDYYYQSAELDDLTIVNNGTNDASFIFEVDGEVQNPTLRLYQNDVEYGILKLNGTFGYIRVNSYDDEQSIYLENTSATSLPNPTSYQDLSVANGSSYITWLKLKVGTSKAVFNCGNIATFNGTITIKFRENYVSI